MRKNSNKRKDKEMKESMDHPARKRRKKTKDVGEERIFHEKTNINDIRKLFENLTKKKEHPVFGERENYHQDVNPGEKDCDKDYPVESSFPFLPDGLVEIFTSLAGKYACNTTTCENDPPDVEKVIESYTDNSAHHDDHLVNELYIVNIEDEERLDDDRPVDSSLPFLPDGLVDIFTSITGKYAAKNSTNENDYPVWGRDKPKHNGSSEEEKPCKRVKTCEGGSWKRGHCDNGDEEEKVIITSCFRESDLTMPRYKTVKRLTKRVKGVREEDSA